MASLTLHRHPLRSGCPCKGAPRGLSARVLPSQGSRGQGPLVRVQASLLSLPVAPLPTVAQPTSQGTLRIFEPEYLALFHHLLDSRPGGSGEGAAFLHVLHPRACPPALLAEGVVDGLPRVGCVAEVRAVRPVQDGTLEVDYVGTRRAKLVMLTQTEPFKVAAAEWYDDWEVSESDVPVDDLELQLMSLLQKVSKLTAALDPLQSAGRVELLPEAVQRYAPPSPARLTSYDALKRSGHAAASAIDMWRRHGSVYDKGPAQQRQRANDPYQVVREQLGSRQRREFFSFAAAQMLELGVPERIALLLSQDTGARLQYVMAAVKPHLLELGAKAALKSTMEGP